MYKLLSATPSPYARKVRIALAEKGIPFELVTEVPWLSTTQTTAYNPLQKLPVLIPPGGAPDSAVYESSFILEWLEAKHPGAAPIYPAGVDERLAAKQVDVVAGGIADAMVLWFFEGQREAARQSPEWAARQHRKVVAGIKWLADRVERAGADGETRFLVGGAFGLADIAAGCTLGYSKVRFAEGWDWPGEYPRLAGYLAGLEKRKSFADTMPAPQSFSEKIV